MNRYSFAFVAWMASSYALAGPGAHGPNGEHLDAPSATAAAAGPSAPRLEASTESFELLARLHDKELSVVVDRFETNEPVLGARIEAEAHGIHDVAEFHADHGDYSFSKPELIQALRRPGQHPVVFTVVAQAESDLVEGTLNVGAVPAGASTATHDDHAHGGDHDQNHDHGHDHDWKRPAIVIAAFLLLTVAGWLARRRTQSGNT